MPRVRVMLCLRWIGLRPTHVLALALTTAAVASCSRSPESDNSEAHVVSPPELPVHSLEPALATLIQSRHHAVLERPSDATAWASLGQAYHAAEFPTQAAECYRRALGLDSRQPGWWHLLALLQLSESPHLALTGFTNALALSPRSEASRLRLAQALSERGRFAGATSHLGILLTQDPGHAGARLELARIHLAEARISEAEALLTPCLTNPYTAKAAMALKGQARLRQGDATGADAWARRAATLPRPFDWPDPELRAVQDLRTDRGRRAEQVQALIQERRWEEAETLLTGLLTDAPDDAEGLLLLGRLRLQQRRVTDADAALVRHLEVRSDSLNGWVQLGITRYAQAQWAAAMEAFGKAIELKPDFAPAHFNLGLARSRAGQGPAAILSFREALRLSPGDPNTLFALADELARAGQNAEARSLLDRVLARDPTHARAAALQRRLTGP